MESVFYSNRSNDKEYATIVIGMDDEKINNTIYNIIKTLFNLDEKLGDVFGAKGIEDNLNDIRNIFEEDNYRYIKGKKKKFFSDYDCLLAKITDMSKCKKILYNWTNVVYEERKIYIREHIDNVDELLIDDNKRNLDDLKDDVLCIISNILDAELEYIYKIQIKNKYVDIIGEIMLNNFYTLFHQ